MFDWALNIPLLKLQSSFLESYIESTSEKISKRKIKFSLIISGLTLFLLVVHIHIKNDEMW